MAEPPQYLTAVFQREPDPPLLQNVGDRLDNTMYSVVGGGRTMLAVSTPTRDRQGSVRKQL